MFIKIKQYADPVLGTWETIMNQCKHSPFVFPLVWLGIRALTE